VFHNSLRLCACAKVAQVGLNKLASNCKLLFWNGLGRLPNWQSTWAKWPKWIMCGQHCGCFSGEDRQQGRQDRPMIWRAALEAVFPLGSAVRDSSVRPPDGLPAIGLMSMTRHDPQPRFPRTGGCERGCGDEISLVIPRLALTA